MTMGVSATDSGFALVNGVDMYWERRGHGGVPVVVVHGGYGTTSGIAGTLDALAVDREVVAVELQGHGHTADIDRPFSWEAFGDDLGELIAALALERADLLGWSLGGGAALRCAIQHPERVRRLVVVSAPCRRDGWVNSTLAGFDQMGPSAVAFMEQTPLYLAYRAVAPDPEAFPTLVEKTGALLQVPYDWGDEVARIVCPTLLVFADGDAIPTAHIADFYARLGGGTEDPGWEATDRRAFLAVLPGRTHYDIFDAPALITAVDGFLRG